MRISFFLEEVEDRYARDNFKRLQDALVMEPVLKLEWKFFEIEAGAVTRASYPHNLNFVPRDVLLLSVSNDQNITFHYDDFTNTHILFTTTGACTARCFIGTYREGILR